jgi:Kdo2-lipid IVA lauroyltransferase/acyltransferase
MSQLNQRPYLTDYLQDLILRGLIGAMKRIPYRWRIPLMGWIVARIIGPIAGYNLRVQDNLALIFPQMPQAEVRRLMRAVPNNVGRTLIEVYSGAEFKKFVANTPISGQGLSAILDARTRGQGVILASGHFGNYDVPRAVLSAQGHSVGALYQPFTNPRFDQHYRKTITEIGAPIFPRGRKGLADMVKHLRGGGILGLLHDQAMGHGAALTFFGKTAKTALSAAEMAIRYDCLLIPVYGVRRPDGLNFDLVIEAPIPHSDPEQMSQALNDSLEAMARAHLDQWFWIHRRWR